jgi:hypothetical protein
LNACGPPPELLATAPGEEFSSGEAPRSIPADFIPARVITLLAAEGITTLEDWRRLTRRQRRGIFGVTASMIRQLDALARGAP